MAMNKKRLADYGLGSERVLWQGKGPGTFENELGDLEDKLMLTTVEKAVAWSQASSVWPDTFGLACCAIEMMSIVSGRVAHKMAAPLRQIYDQMLEPKWVIAMGACASSSGVFNNYALVCGADKFLPVDVHVPGCPPRPESLMHGVLKLQRMVQGNPDLGWRTRYQAEGTEEWPHPNASGEAT